MKEEITLGCVGKLPFKAEFIEENVSNTNIKLVEDWLQEGFVHVNRDALIRNKKESVLNLNHGLLFNYGIGRKPILGHIFDSKDSCGRIYPAIFFKELNNPNFIEIQHAAPLTYQSFYQNLYNIKHKNWAELSYTDFLAQLISADNLTPNFSNTEFITHQQTIFSSVSIKTFWQQVMGLKSFRYLGVFLNRFVKIIQTLNSQSIWQVKLPIAKTQPSYISISFWLSLIKAMRALNYRNMHLIWTYDNVEDAHLIIYHGVLSIAFFRSIFDKSDVRIPQSNLLDVFTQDQTVTEIFEYDPDDSLNVIIKRFDCQFKPEGRKSYEQYL